ncbi:MAG: CCA tRNA nucleotidyltransferase [Bryobacterales bacterium]
MTEQELARHIVVTLRETGHEAYWAGGCVRDLLLGREPADYDVATAALPADIQRYFPNSRAVGAQFGVILVREEETEVAVATFRLDHDYLDGRRPSDVSFTRSAEQDVQRRDFTINGLLFDPLENRHLDFVGGRKDLDARLVRAIGSPAERFSEDKLRMLRAVRFAARLDFTIETGTFQAIRNHAPQIAQISPERIRDELNRILTEGAARRGFELLDKTGLLQVILPEVARMKGVAQPPQFHPEGDVWTHTLLMLENLQNPTVALALGTLLHDVGKPPTYRVAERIRFDGHVEAGIAIAQRICERLRYSSKETEQVVALVANHMRFGEVQRMRQSTLKRFLRLPSFDEHLELHRLDCLSSHRDLVNYDFVRQKESELDEQDLHPTPLLTGNDLIAAGYEPGPLFKEILAEVESAQLEGSISSREQAMEYVEKRFGRR